MIKVLLFAGHQEAAGKDTLEVDARGIESIEHLKVYLQQEYKLTKLDEGMTAVNEEFVPDDTRIKSGDTIAFIPPVSGG